jgi:alpha,alpha-trehalose phosphorylase
VSFTHRPVAAICYEVEPVDGPARITLQSELTANEQLPPAGADHKTRRSAAARRRDRSPRRLPGTGAG